MKHNLLISSVMLLIVAISCSKTDVKSNRVETFDQKIVIRDAKFDFSLNLNKRTDGEIEINENAIKALDQYFKSTFDLAQSSILESTNLDYNDRDEFLIYLNYIVEGKNLPTLITFGANEILSNKNFLMMVPKEKHTCTGAPCVKCSLNTEEKDGKTIVKGCSCDLVGTCNHSVSIEI